jgi:hypothetical protein
MQMRAQPTHRILKVAGARRKEAGHVRSASLAGGRGETTELLLGALHYNVPNGEDEH